MTVKPMAHVKVFFAQLNTPNAFYRGGETTNNMKEHSQSMS